MIMNLDAAPINLRARHRASVARLHLALVAASLAPLLLLSFSIA
jgi:hypothetical protein